MSKTSSASSTKFIDYLDSHCKNGQYIDFAITNSVVEQHFLEGAMNDARFANKFHQSDCCAPLSRKTGQCGGGSLTVDKGTTLSPDISKKTLFNSNLDLFWNIMNKKPLESTYSIWQKEHDATTAIAPSPLPKTSKIDIDMSMNTISDLISIINNNEYDETVEYNIDLKSLHNIKMELICLQEMIGMESMKQSVLNQLVYFTQELHIGTDTSDFKHTVLYGPPGTGKTEVAKIIGRMYSKLGILKNNFFKKVTRNDLIAGYLGQTAIKTKKVIDECVGGVLFIDEAYSLANNSENDSYSKECLDILCESLSDHKNDLMVIIAGYEEELSHTFFKANRGLESRFIWRFTMEPYSSKELMGIFKKMVQDQGWQIADETALKEAWFEKNKDCFQNYGRDMELLLTYTKIAHGRRIYGKGSELRKKISMDDLNGGHTMMVKNKKIKKTPCFMHTIYT